VLVEQRDAQLVGALDAPAVRSEDPTSNWISVDLPLPFGPSRPRRVPGPSSRLTSSRTRALAERLGDMLGTTSRLVRRSLAAKSMPATRPVLRCRTSASSPVRRAASSMRAFALVVRAFGPWRSQSSSRRTRLPSVSCH
jgi:hypothetical protein